MISDRCSGLPVEKDKSAARVVITIGAGYAKSFMMLQRAYAFKPHASA